MPCSARLMSTSALNKPITQVAHGFSVGEMVKFAGGVYALAQADSLVNSGVQIGMVSALNGADSFWVSQTGYVTALTTGPYTANTLYYLSESAAGELTSTPPSGAGEYIRPCFITDTTTSGYVVSAASLPVILTPNLKYSLMGIGEPTTGDDDTAGYSAGSIWIDVMTNIAYICLDASTGAAVWDIMSIADGSIGFTQLSEEVMRSVRVTVTSAQWNLLYSAPFSIIAAAGVGKLIVVHRVAYEVDYVSAQFTSGGAFGLQYGNTAALAGIPASDTIAATVAQGWAADSYVGATGAMGNGAWGSMVNTGIFLSNDTGVFATGDSAVYVTVYYSILIPTI